MPALRSNKQTPTSTASDGTNHPPRRSARLMEKGPWVSLVDVQRLRRAGKAKAKAVKSELSPPALIPTPARPLLRIDTVVASSRNPNGYERQVGIGCCAFRTPCAVCFSHDHFLTPLHPDPSYHQLPLQQTPRSGTLRPAVWSSTASEFSLPSTPAQDYRANFYTSNVDTNPREYADPTRLHGLQNMYHHIDLFTAFAGPGQGFNPFRLVTTSGTEPVFTHIVRLLKQDHYASNDMEDPERHDHSLPGDSNMYWQQTYESSKREVGVLTLVLLGENLTARQLEAARQFMCDHLPESRIRGDEPHYFTSGLLHESATTCVPGIGCARVLILVPIDSVPVPVVASPTEGSAGLSYSHGHIIPPGGLWQQNFSQIVNAFSIASLSLYWSRKKNWESLREALRTHLYTVKSGCILPGSMSDNRERALVSAVPFRLLAKVLKDAEDAMNEGQDDDGTADAVSTYTD
ncbi:hypothetical protein D9619_002214 [Psilocybe cf. subviscida]|uniref:Uncharacterized protein n=1 Tax=Psilocybe cf. subviscida TaxID=2480587 RepID=A0A8H5BCD6_9AGAR|nr:hypothetical protein D9619_002214 [Psilocybe cf. subviscida]